MRKMSKILYTVNEIRSSYNLVKSSKFEDFTKFLTRMIELRINSASDFYLETNQYFKKASFFLTNNFKLNTFLAAPTLKVYKHILKAKYSHKLNYIAFVALFYILANLYTKGLNQTNINQNNKIPFKTIIGGDIGEKNVRTIKKINSFGTSNDSNDPNDPENPNNNFWKIILIALFLLGFFGFILYLFKTYQIYQSYKGFTTETYKYIKLSKELESKLLDLSNRQERLFMTVMNKHTEVKESITTFTKKLMPFINVIQDLEERFEKFEDITNTKFQNLQIFLEKEFEKIDPDELWKGFYALKQSIIQIKKDHSEGLANILNIIQNSIGEDEGSN